MTKQASTGLGGGQVRQAAYSRSRSSFLVIGLSVDVFPIARSRWIHEYPFGLKCNYPGVTTAMACGELWTVLEFEGSDGMVTL